MSINAAVGSPSESEGDTTPRSRVSGIDRALQILDYLYETGEPAGAYVIAKAIGAPLSTVYVTIENLSERNMLSRQPDGSVWLGARLYHYGLAYARSLDFLTVATHEMHELCRGVGETVQLCSREGDYMLVIGMAEGPGHFRVASRVGSRVPLNWTASGRLLVGHLPIEERIALFRRCAKSSPTGRAEVDPVVLANAAEKSLSARLSLQAGESDYAVACIASPICDTTGACIATISIVLPEQKALDANAGFDDAVKEAAERIEIEMAWRNR